MYFITRNIEVFNRIKIYIIKLGLFEATRVSEQREKVILYVKTIKSSKNVVLKNLAHF